MASLKERFPILKSWKTILISCLASAFEFYDFGVIGFFTSSIGAALFPPLSELQYKHWVYALFWAGFCTRPLGGAFFGYISDKYGRKKAFRLSIISMAICTFITGCIPTYNTIGGEISAVFVYLYEVAPPHRRATWMSFIVISSVGAMFATLVKITIDQTLTEEQTLSWGWRIPFWIGILLALLGWYSKRALTHTPVFLQMVQETQTDIDEDEERTITMADKFLRSSAYLKSDSELENPFTVACCGNTERTIVFIFATALNQVTPFLLNIFLPDYLSKESMHGWADTRAYEFNAYLMIISAIWIVCIGFCTDKYGPLRFLITSSVLTMLISPVMWYMLSETSSAWQDFLLSLVMVLIPNITNGAVYFWYIDTLLTDPRTRTRIFGVAFNIGAVLFAGTAPVLGTFFIEMGGITRGAILIGIWVSITAFISLSAYLYEHFKHGSGHAHRYVEEVSHEEQEQLASLKQPASVAHAYSDSRVEHDYLSQLKPS
eukprot:280747_1